MKSSGDDKNRIIRNYEWNRLIGFVFILVGIVIGMVIGGVIGTTIGNPERITYVGGIAGSLAGFGLAYLIVRRKHNIHTTGGL